MRVSERLGSLVFIQKHVFQRTQQLSRGNFSSQVFIYTYNFGCGNLQCSRHKPLNLSKGFYSPGLAVLTLFRCCLQHLSLAFARCVSGFVDSIFEYIGIYLHLFVYIYISIYLSTWKDVKRHQKTWPEHMDPYVYPFVFLGHSGWLCRNEWLCMIPAGMIFKADNPRCNLESCSGRVQNRDV